MASCFVKLSVLLLCLGVSASVVRADDCDKEDSPLTCHSVRVVRNVVQQFMAPESNSILKLANGIELIETPETETSARSAEDGSFMGRVSRYLQTHELKLKLAEILPKEEFGVIVKNAMKSYEDESGVVEGRKKDKGGQGGLLMMMGLMMGKMMAAVGFGGIGLIAMKALGVAMMALMLAAIAGVKKLSEGHDDGGHQVIYAQAHDGGYGHGHRRKRGADEDDSVPLPYRGWSQYAIVN